MKTKEKVLELYNKGFTQSSVAKMVGVSRQRVSQIVNNYSTKGSANVRSLVLRRDKKTCQWGEKCIGKEQDLQIHHIDSNSENNSLNNLITLCKECHTHFHKLEKESELKKYICYICRKKYNCWEGDVSNGDKRRCYSCAEKKKEERKKYWCYKYKLMECKKCGSSEKTHSDKGLCTTCYGRFLYKTSEKRRTDSKNASQKWKKNNPEKAKAIQKRASKKYYISKKK